MPLADLPQATAAMIARAAAVPGVGRYILIGGTALALQVGHRVSEDLDFVENGPQLDRRHVMEVVRRLAERSPPKLVTPQSARDDMDMAGLDIDDVQQDWLVDGVKITFFAPAMREQLDVYRDAPVHDLEGLRVLGVEGIFSLKSMVLLDRRTSRDAFDLWWFMDRGGRSVQEVLDAMGGRAAHRQLDDLLRLLSPLRFPDGDVGFETRDPAAPQDPDELRRRLAGLVALYRRERAGQEVRTTSRGPERVLSPWDGRSGRDGTDR